MGYWRERPAKISAKNRCILRAGGLKDSFSAIHCRRSLAPTDLASVERMTPRRESFSPPTRGRGGGKKFGGGGDGADVVCPVDSADALFADFDWGDGAGRPVRRGGDAEGGQPRRQSGNAAGCCGRGNRYPVLSRGRSVVCFGNATPAGGG